MPQNRLLIRKIIVGVMVLLPVQYMLVGVIGIHSSEPWPALVMPGFQRVWDASGLFVVPTVVLNVHFADGSQAEVSPDVLFFDLPRSHHRAFLEAQFRPATLSGTPATEGARHTDAARWLRARLDRLYPDHQAVRLHACWREIIHQPAAPERPSTFTALDTLFIDLRRP